MDNERDKDDAALDALFAASKARTPPLADDFLARLQNDADAHLPKAAVATPAAKPQSFFRNLKAIFAASGLSGAAALGVWIGLVMPDIVTVISPIGDETLALSSFLPGADLTVFNE